MPPTIDAPAVALAADDDRGDEEDRSSSGKLSGLMKPCLLANSAPDRPPMAAPIAKASSLNRKVGTPMSSAASSSSRVASQARPTRLFLMSLSRNSTMMMTVRASQ